MPKKAQKKKPIKVVLGTPNAEFTIERLYNAPVEKVWKALTANEEIRQWYFDLPEFKAVKGFEFQFLGGKDQEHLYRHLCKVTEVISNKKLSYSWQYDGYVGYSEVSFELFEDGKKTRVKLTHTGINTFPQNNEDFSSNNFAVGWTYIINKSLKEHVEKKRVIMFNMITIDGYFEGSKPWELDWHNVNPEFNEFAINQLESIDCIIFGRKTYEGMASYWLSAEAKENDPIVAELMNDSPKVVFSTTLKTVDWKNTTIASGSLKEEIQKLKQKYEKDLILLGSANLALELMKEGLIDELRLMICPIIIGKGRPMFTELRQKVNLLKTMTFKSGNVLLYYKV